MKLSRLYRILALATLPVGLLSASGPAQASHNGELVNLIAVHSGMCLDVANESHSNGAALIQWPCKRVFGNLKNQQFTMVPMGAGYQLIAAHSGKCVDVSEVSTRSGQPVHQWECLGASQRNQIWLLNSIGDSQYQIEAAHSGKCLEVEGGAYGNAARVIQNDCVKWKNGQVWKINNLASTGTSEPVPNATDLQSPGPEVASGVDQQVIHTGRINVPHGTAVLRLFARDGGSLVARRRHPNGISVQGRYKVRDINSAWTFEIPPCCPNAGLFYIRSVKTGELLHRGLNDDPSTVRLGYIDPKYSTAMWEVEWANGGNYVLLKNRNDQTYLGMRNGQLTLAKDWQEGRQFEWEVIDRHNRLINNFEPYRYAK